MSGSVSRRFWSDVAVAEGEQGFAVLLDGKPVRLPDAGVLELPNRTLAEAVAAEWRRIDGAYGPDAIGLTRLAGSMLFRVTPRRTDAEAGFASFLDGELLCYRAAHPETLAAQQEQDWQPWLRWCRDTLGVELAVTTGLMPIRQNDAAHAAIARALSELDDAGLTALGVLAPSLNSLVLALACVSGALSAARASALSVLDERFQEERWGRDAEAVQRQQRLLADCQEAECFLGYARGLGETRLLVSGRVQGVGYRAWMHAEATRLGLGGFVRNLSDGRVEALLRGTEAARAEMEDAARRGPRMADVQALESSQAFGGQSNRFDGALFEIKPEADASTLPKSS